MMRSLRLFLCLFVPLILLLPTLAAPDAPDVFSLIWQNKQSDARALCETTLKKDPRDARALLGLAMILGYEDAKIASLQAWQRYFVVAPDSWQAQAYWPRVVALAQDTNRWDILLDIVQSILASPNCTPELKSSARMLQAYRTASGKAPSRANQPDPKFGYLQDWMVIGPFDNISLSGFEKAFPPEQEIDYTKSYKGLNDQLLSWHPLKLVSPGGYCRIGMALGDEDESVFYAVTAVNSPQEQAVQLSIDLSGAAKIFLNGRCVYSNDLYLESTTYCADTYHFPVTLQQGWNTLLIKIVSNDTLTAGFSTRFITLVGADLPAFTADCQKVTAKAVAGDLPTAVDESTVALLRSLPDSPEVALALGYRLRLISDYEASEKVLRTALTQHPKNGWLHWELEHTLSEDEQADEARAERDLAIQHNGRIVAAQLDKLYEEKDSLDSAEYVKQVKALCAQYPVSPYLHWALYDAYANAEMETETLNAARAAMTLAPGLDSVGHLYSILTYYNRTSEAAKLLADTLLKEPNSTALLSMLGEEQVKQGKLPAAIATYKKLVQLDPAWTSYRQSLLDCYIAQKNLKQAEQELLILHEQCPQDAYICARYADLLCDLKRTKEAIDFYQQAMRLNPGHIEWREKIQLVTGNKPVIDLAPPTDAAPLLAKAAKMETPPGVSAVFLLNEARQVVYPDFATDLRAHLIIKICDEAGASSYEYMSMRNVTSTSVDTVEKARVIKADGKSQDYTEECDSDGIAFPSLEPGDTIELQYRIQDYHPGALAKHVWDEWAFTEEDAPVELSRFVLIVQPSCTFRTATHGEVPKPTVKEVNGWQLHEWQAKDIPAFRTEEYGPEGSDSGSWLDISTIPSWGDIVNWYRDLAGPFCEPDDAITEKAEELTKDAKTEEEKIKALVAFVARKIQYQSTPFRMSAYIPTNGKKVMRERYGDCKDKAALLTAMLSAVGIKAEMVLLSGRSYGLTPYLPSPRFTHAITVIHTANGPLWVDATADQLEYRAFPFEDQGVPALIISDATKELTTTPVLSVEKDAMVMKYNMKLDEEGTLSGNYEINMTGKWGWMFRSIIKEMPEAKHKEFLRDMIQQFVHKNALYESGSIGNIPDQEIPLLLRTKCHVEDYSASAEDLLLVRLPWQTLLFGLNAVLSDKTRTQPLELALYSGRTASTVRLELPAGYTAQSLSPAVEASSPWGKYTLKYKMDGNVLQAELDFLNTAMRVDFADIPKYREFIRGLTQAMEKQLVLKKN